MTNAPATIAPELTRAEALEVFSAHARTMGAAAVRNVQHDVCHLDEVVHWTAEIDASDPWRDENPRWVHAEFAEHWPQVTIAW